MFNKIDNINDNDINYLSDLDKEIIHKSESKQVNKCCRKLGKLNQNIQKLVINCANKLGYNLNSENNINIEQTICKIESNKQYNSGLAIHSDNDGFSEPVFSILIYYDIGNLDNNKLVFYEDKWWWFKAQEIGQFKINNNELSCITFDGDVLHNPSSCINNTAHPQKRCFFGLFVEY